MHSNIFCTYADGGAWCKHKQVKRSLLGFGARMCILYSNPNGYCQYQQKPSKPIAPPPPPQPPLEQRIKQILYSDNDIEPIAQDNRAINVNLKTKEINQMTTTSEKPETYMILDHGGDGVTATYTLSYTNNGNNDQRITMYFDPTDFSWTTKVRGKWAAKLKDHGNGVNIQLRNKKKLIKLDYCGIRDLYLLLDVYYKNLPYGRDISYLPAENK